MEFPSPHSGLIGKEEGYVRQKKSSFHTGETLARSLLRIFPPPTSGHRYSPWQINERGFQFFFFFFLQLETEPLAYSSASLSLWSCSMTGKIVIVPNTIESYLYCYFFAMSEEKHQASTSLPLRHHLLFRLKERKREKRNFSF